jgi:hypothetical protein
VCFTATVVTGLFQEINLLIVELLAGLHFHSGESKMMTIHWFQGYYVCISSKTRFARPGLLRLALLVITHFSRNGPFMEKLVYFTFCSCLYMILFIYWFILILFLVPVSFQWISRLQHHLTCVLFVGYIHWSLHGQLCCGTVYWVCWLSTHPSVSCL